MCRHMHARTEIRAESSASGAAEGQRKEGGGAATSFATSVYSKMFQLNITLPRTHLDTRVKLVHLNANGCMS